ncbi:MAG: hypothetical protein WDN72_04330 [Alphaproteobacteria bacterium]
MFQNTSKDKNRPANAMSDFKSSKDELRDDVDQLKADARETIDDARKAAKSRSLRSVAHDAGERVQDFLSEKKDQAHDVRVSAERTIRSNPLVATAAAFAAGAVLARLFRRR